MLKRVLVLPVANEDSFFYVFSHIFAAILTNSLGTGLLLALSLIDITGHTRFVMLFLCVFSLLLSVALEETFHVVTALALNRAQAIRGVVIHTIAVKRIPLFCCKAAVRFAKTEITDKEYATIAFGGPFFTLISSVLISLPILLLWSVKGLPVVFFLLITPIISLIPSKYKAFESDGHIISRLGQRKMIRTELRFMMRAVFRQMI